MTTTMLDAPATQESGAVLLRGISWAPRRIMECALFEIGFGKITPENRE
jgi:hypothetical protein